VAILISNKAHFIMQYILFDLDGTLIDHFTTIYKSVAYAQRELGLPESDYGTVRATVGGSLPITLSKLCGEANVAAAEPLFRQHFDKIIFDDVFALPGADWILKSLKESGAKLGVFTNKYTSHSRSVLAHLGLDQWLDVIIGTGDLECPYRKPDPLFTAHALEQMDCASEEALMIGDSPYDLAAAEAGCITCHLVATGSHSSEELSEYIVTEHIHQDLYQLGEKLFGLTPVLADR
jgi:phosphoglycolate phosphatase